MQLSLGCWCYAPRSPGAMMLVTAPLVGGRFDEGAGVYSANAVDPLGEAELHNVLWVKGEFGNALRFTGTDSFVILPSIAKLDGSDEMSVATWVYWEGTGQYPNILTGGSWSPGGFLVFVNGQSCSFRMGRPGHRHGVAGEKWTETSAPLLAKLPMNKWVHLAAVFKRPEITTYVNGNKVGSAKWDYPVGHQGAMHLGRWSGAVSHAGLIDDVRIYGRALSADEVLALANRKGREASGYTELGPAETDAKELLCLETRWATMRIGDDGTILSLKEKDSGRELIAERQPVLAIQQTSGRWLHARRMRWQDDLLIDCNMAAKDTDAWIELARRGGFPNITCTAGGPHWATMSRARLTLA